MIDTATRQTRRARTALSKATFTCATALCAAAGLGMLDGPIARADHYKYTISKLGFTDSDHTPPSGDRVVLNPFMNAVGQAIANQTRFNATPDSSQSALFFDPNITGPLGLRRIGFFGDADHTSNAGAEFSNVQFLNDAGYATGTSNRFSSSTGLQADPTGISAWVYFNGTTTRVGLFDSAHRNATGNQLSNIVALNSLGDVIGTSQRFLANGTQEGLSAFITPAGGSSERIGLDVSTAGANIHRRQDGVEYSEAQFLGNDGVSAGFSRRYVQVDPQNPPPTPDLTQIGQSAWLRPAGVNTTAIEAGFIASTPGGTPATDLTNYTRQSDGRRDSSVLGLNNSGSAIGTSTRYSSSTGSSTSLGSTAWYQSVTGGGPVRIGLTDGEHTQSGTGVTNSTPQKINDAGYVVGTATRYRDSAGGTSSGTTGWRYDSGTNTTQRLGLRDDEHTGTSPTGDTNVQTLAQGQTTLYLSATGHAAGVSQRYLVGALGGHADNTQAGQSAWFQAQGSSQAVRIGLTDDTGLDTGFSFTRPNNGTGTNIQGTQSSSVVAINDDGAVVGHSLLYVSGMPTSGAGSANSGQAAWISTVSGTTATNTRIGLFDFAHTRSPGTSSAFESTTVLALNDAGHAVGTSNRYNGNPVQAGQSAWFYDGTTSIPLDFSTNSTDNGTFTSISYLSDDDVVLGTYTLYGPGGTIIGDHAFLWDYNLTDSPGTPTDDRFFDLGTLVVDQNGNPGLAPDWSSLNSALQMSSLGHILGVGTLTSTGGSGSLPFVLTPVPEPTGVALLAATGLLVLPRRRRTA